MHGSRATHTDDGEDRTSVAGSDRSYEPRSRRWRALAVAAGVVVVLAGCSDTDGDGDLDADPVTAAEELVERAEEGLDEARGAFDDASEQFCRDSESYVQAVDAYGGLLTDAEATVGAVRAGGADLVEPREEVGDSVDDVKAARDALVAAEQALIDAQAALDEARTGTTAEPSDTTTTEALVPDDVVGRVEQAESDLADAFDGVDDATPLSDASERVNAAAVSVQVAWVQLFAEAGCLDDEGQAELVTAVADHTRALQSALATAGYFDGEVDGVYGPATVEAVEQLQSDSDLPVTGLLDRATSEALDAAVEAAGGQSAADELTQTAALQTVLTLTGHWTGPIDGEWTDALTAALQEFQTDVGVEPTGVVDAATIAAAQQALDEARTPDTTTTTEADEPDDSDDSSTTTTTS